MRSIFKFLMVIMAFVTLSIGCSNDNSAFNYPDGTVDPDGIIDRNSNGYLSLEGFYLCVETETESFKDSSSSPVSTTKGDEDSDLIDISDYIVEITSEDSGEVIYSDSYANTKGMESYFTLKAGAYYVSVFSSYDDDIALADWDCPEYSGEQRYVVGDEKITSVDEVTCSMSNVMASVSMSIDLIEKFDPSPTNSDLNLQVILSVSGNELSFNPKVSEQKGYFKAPSDGKMTVYLVGMYDVSTDDNAEPSYFEIAKGDWTQEIYGVMAGQYRNVAVKIDYNETGSIQIGLTVETWTYDTTIDVDIISKMLYTLAEDVIYEANDETTVEGSPTITLDNGLNIEDTYYISSSIIDSSTDTYSPTYKANITPSSGSSVESVKLIVSSSSSDLIATLSGYGFTEEEYFTLFEGGVFTQSATLGSYISMVNDGNNVVVALKYNAIVALCNYTGVHTIKVQATDSEGRSSFTTLTLETEATYTGLEPEVIWNDYTDEEGNVYSYDIYTRYEVFEDETLNPKFNFSIISQHENGITSLVVSIISDVLTNEILESVGLVADMDLINAEGTIKDNLIKLGLPVGDDVLGQSNIEIDITEFMPLLAILSAGKSDFKIVVSDDYDTTEAVIMVEKK